MAENDRALFESAVATLRADVTAAAAMVTYDGQVRTQYQGRITAYVEELRGRVRAGELTWRQAAADAQQMRNSTMELLRGRSTPVGRSIAEFLKREGRTMNELVARYTIRLFGGNANFNRLSPAQQNQVYAEIVAAAARSNPRVDLWVRRASRAGRGLLVLSLALSTYAIATSPDPAATARREGAVLGAGIAGGVAGGALAGLACGPGAPVCVAIGAFVGGTAVALGVDLMWGS